jgi:hypothetical protein
MKLEKVEYINIEIEISEILDLIKFEDKEGYELESGVEIIRENISDEEREKGIRGKIIGFNFSFKREKI